MTAERLADEPLTHDVPTVHWLDQDAPAASSEPDPGLVMRTCANCGAEMDERKCKLICRCGYFLSCSDYY